MHTLLTISVESSAYFTSLTYLSSATVLTPLFIPAISFTSHTFAIWYSGAVLFWAVASAALSWSSQIRTLALMFAYVREFNYERMHVLKPIFKRFLDPFQ